MKKYEETLSKFDEDYYKNLVGKHLPEKVERYNEVGHVCRVSLRWRGKYYHLQLFFPGSGFPSRKDVEAQVNKIYPDAVVMVHYASESDPSQPLVRIGEETAPGATGIGSKIQSGLKKVFKAVDKSPLGKFVDRSTTRRTINKSQHDAQIQRNSVELEGEVIDEKSKYYKGNPKEKKGGNPKPEAGDVRVEDKNYVEFMKRINHLHDDTKKAIENLDNDPNVVKAALEISGLPK